MILFFISCARQYLHETSRVILATTAVRVEFPEAPWLGVPFHLRVAPYTEWNSESTLGDGLLLGLPADLLKHFFLPVMFFPCVTWMIQAVEYSYSLWNGKRKCLDLEFPNHMIGCKGYFWRGDGFNRIWVSSTKHGDTIDLHWVLTINPFNFEITSWSQLNHWISFVFCRFCPVLSLLKRTQQPLDPFDSPQVSWKPRSSSTSASRSCVARG